MNVTGVVLVLLALIVVAVMAYRAGYVRGQDELLQWHRSIAAERNALRMTVVLPRWRRLSGWAAYGFAGLLNCLFLALAFSLDERGPVCCFGGRTPNDSALPQVGDRPRCTSE